VANRNHQKAFGNCLGYVGSAQPGSPSAGSRNCLQRIRRENSLRVLLGTRGLSKVVCTLFWPGLSLVLKGTVDIKESWAYHVETDQDQQQRKQEERGSYHTERHVMNRWLANW
jgi:hypothetical protein